MYVAIDVLKVQRREGVREDFDGVQFTVLSGTYIHAYIHTYIHTCYIWTIYINTYIHVHLHILSIDVQTYLQNVYRILVRTYIHTVHTYIHTLLPDLYLHVATEFPDFAGQIVFTVSLNTDTLVDVLGRESEVGQGFTLICMYVCMYVPAHISQTLSTLPSPHMYIHGIHTYINVRACIHTYIHTYPAHTYPEHTYIHIYPACLEHVGFAAVSSKLHGLPFRI
jgi:hypothetical protein